MPELPEVETIRRDLAKCLIGKKIAKVLVLKKKMVRGSHASFAKTLVNKKIKNISRRGKLLIIELEGKKWLLIHLKMTGQLIYQAKAGELYTHTHVVFDFSDKSRLYFNDARQFGYLQIVDETTLKKIINQYGIEPLTKDYTLESFAKIFSKRKAPVKSILLNQKLIAGIGNIYADEICFAAGVMPARPSLHLKPVEIKKLWLASEKIITKAIKERGTSSRDYRDAFGEKGNFVRHLKVYGRGGDQCARCKAHILKEQRLLGRATVFCPVCQK